MRFLIFLTGFIFLQFRTFAGFTPPENDELSGAIIIQNTAAFCSNDAAYHNLEATSSNLNTPLNWGATGKDVWFKFTATKYAINISVSGRVNAMSLNTMLNPLVAIYTENEPGSYAEIPGTVASSNNVTSLYHGALVPGRTYYVRVSATNNNTGTFKLCLDNYFPPIQPGQDCGTFSLLCSKETFTQLNVSGAGLNNRESEGTCLGTESNSAWYMFKASKGGDFTFLITPTDISNDIDWIFYDLGIDGNCSNVNAENAIRCAAGSGVNCNPSYYKTGLDMNETDLRESAGCVPGQNGLVKYVDLIEGHTYALLIDNYSTGNNGFTLEFGGTADFAGPTAEIQLEKLNPCTDNQAYIFSCTATNFASLNWSFGEGANISTSTSAGPFTITYNTPGEKVVVLEAKGSNGCKVVTTQTFIVAKTPAKPAITASDLSLCEGDILALNTPFVSLATYHWSGPNSFTSAEQNPNIKITGPEYAGKYQLYIAVGDCVSEVSEIEIQSVDMLPKAAFSIDVNNRCESDQSYTLNNLSTGYTKLTWSLGADIRNQADMANESKRITFLTPGTKTISLTVETANGCLSTYTKEILVKLRPETPEISVNQQAFCLGDTIKLSVPAVEGIVYQWTGPHNFTSSNSSVNIPVKDFNVSGLYQVTLTSGSCVSDIASVNIPEIARVPIASFSTDPNFNIKFAVPAAINFINQSQYGDYYLWDFGDGFSSSAISPKHIYQFEGNFKITLTAFSQNDCFHSVSIGDLVIKRSASIFVPGAFSPNGDNVNDELIIGITNLKKYRLQIYNRLGNQVFATDNIFDNWKGDFKGNQLPVGVYFYLINGINLTDEPVRFSGSVTLIR